MGQIVDGGIEEHQNLKRFTASPSNIAAKDQIDLMSWCWFSLTPNRTEPIEHQFVNLKTKQTESVRITGSLEHGIATIHDQDLIIFAVSHWVEAKSRGLEPSRRICFTPYQFFTWMNKPANGPSYARLREALQRLKTTNVETTIRSEKQNRGRMKQFSWISEWEIVEESGKVRGVEVVLAEWLFESIQNYHVLTLDKRYFDIPGSVERWLYLYARKATGGAQGIWKETFKSLHKKSASQQAFKHYAHALRRIIQRNDLPGLRLAQKASQAGEDMLVMERLEKRVASTAQPAQQSTLFEQSPLEEAWENVLEILRKQLGNGIVKSWLEKLQVLAIEDGSLTYRAPTRFIADHVQSRYGHRVKAAWEAIGHHVTTLARLRGFDLGLRNLSLASRSFSDERRRENLRKWL